MRLIEKIAYITFWINIFFVLFIFIMPVIIIKIPDLFDLLTANKGLNPYNLTFSFLYLGVAFHWGYCIWFWYKNDKYSKSIFPLLFLTGLYAPLYYYRVKIKKRPLRNKISKPIQIEKEDNSINDNDFIELTRKNIIGVLQLWTSKNEQLEYHKSVPIAQVSTELFGQWDDFYTPDAEVMKDAFKPYELELLKKFDKELTERTNKSNSFLPDIEEYIETDDWKALNLLAKEIITELK